MFSPLRNRFGIPGVISVIALVFAMFGGAYAASNNGDGATASAKKNNKAGKRGPRGPRGKQGPAGPAGPAGPQGPAGAKGAAGAAGKDGVDGTNGTSATTVSFAGAKGGCTEGGLEVKSASPAAFVCNGAKGTNGGDGEDGSPWTLDGTLPAGKVLTGAWTMSLNNLDGAPAALEYAAISFPLPLKASLSESDVHVGPHANCGGTAAAPTASDPDDDGELCVYTGSIANAGFLPDAAIPIRRPSTFGGGADTGGATLVFLVSANEANGFGTFAVVGPPVP